MWKSLLGRFRIVSFIEGLSFIILLGIAMPLKYYAGMPDAVRVVGMAHGVLFIAYCFLGLQATLVYGWSFGRALLLFVASLIPFGTFYADYRWLRPEAEQEKA